MRVGAVIRFRASGRTGWRALQGEIAKNASTGEGLRTAFYNTLIFTFDFK
jgi:hypothetical protein